MGVQFMKIILVASLLKFVCPKLCGVNEILCSTGFDANDCKNPDHCIPKGTDLDGNFCPAECPSVCDSETQSLCQGGTKANGCKENEYCVAKTVGTNGEPCPVLCEHNLCSETGTIIPGEPDANGCPTASTCAFPKILGPWNN